MCNLFGKKSVPGTPGSIRDSAKLVTAYTESCPGAGTCRVSAAAEEETGRGAAAGPRLMLPLPAGAGDAEFAVAWTRVEAFLERFPSEFILFRRGAVSLPGDPIAHLRCTGAAHTLAAGPM